MSAIFLSTNDIVMGSNCVVIPVHVVRALKLVELKVIVFEFVREKAGMLSHSYSWLLYLI